jgi:glutaredoxin
VRTAAGLAILLSLGIWAAGAAQAQTVYKSVGPDGQVVYGDRPPIQGHLEKTMKFENLPASVLPAATSSYVEKLRKMEAADAADAVAAVSSSGTVLYSAAWCGYCKQAKAWLASKGVPYRDIDVDTREGMKALAKVGVGRGIPVIVADGRSVTGFSAGAYDALFAGRK